MVIHRNNKRNNQRRRGRCGRGEQNGLRLQEQHSRRVPQPPSPSGTCHLVFPDPQPSNRRLPGILPRDLREAQTSEKLYTTSKGGSIGNPTNNKWLEEVPLFPTMPEMSILFQDIQT